MANGMILRVQGRTDAGMFPNERVFIITGHSGELFTVIVPDSFIEERDGVPTLRVRVLDSARGISLVRVPGEALSSSTISVADSSLVPA